MLNLKWKPDNDAQAEKKKIRKLKYKQCWNQFYLQLVYRATLLFTLACLFRAKLFVISNYFLSNIPVSANISGGTISSEVLDPL